MTNVLFTTIHGSRLYGFNHEGSDYDTYTVTDSPSRRVHQAVTGDQDHVTVGLDHFLALAHSGSHQAVEALFSPFKEWTEEGEKYRPMIEATRIGGGEVFLKYERTIRKFAYGDFKKRRHAVRLAWGLHELRLVGKLWPQLNPDGIAASITYANDYADDQLLDVLLCPRTSEGQTT